MERKGKELSPCIWIDFSLQKKSADSNEIERDADGFQHADSPECCVIAQALCNHTAGKDTDTETEIPLSEGRGAGLLLFLLSAS